MPFVENARDEARATVGYDEQSVQGDAKTFMGDTQNYQVMDIEKRGGCSHCMTVCVW